MLVIRVLVIRVVMVRVIVVRVVLDVGLSLLTLDDGAVFEVAVKVRPFAVAFSTFCMIVVVVLSQRNRRKDRQRQ